MVTYYNRHRYRKSHRDTLATSETTNLIYLLTCSISTRQYVGETKHLFRTSMGKHPADITHNETPPMAGQYNTRDHTLSSLLMELIEVMTSDQSGQKCTDQEREFYWIHQLRTLEPLGLNMAGQDRSWLPLFNQVFISTLSIQSQTFSDFAEVGHKGFSVAFTLRSSLTLSLRSCWMSAKGQCPLCIPIHWCVQVLFNAWMCILQHNTDLGVAVTIWWVVTGCVFG